MWKIPAFTMILATMLLGGCNWGDDNANQETPMEDVGNDVKNGVNDVQNDVEKGINDVEDAVTPDTNNEVYDRDANGVNNNGTMNDNGTVNDNNVEVPETTTPNTNVTPNETNGTIREDNVKIREDENTTTR